MGKPGNPPFEAAAPPPSGSAGDLNLWYRRPAREWVESLPIGNGRLLATNQGGVRCEVIQLNEDTIWSGQPVDRDQPGAYEAILEARELILAGEYGKAHELVGEKVLAPHDFFGGNVYQTLGDLNLFYDYEDKSLIESDYRRDLDLDRAVSSVSYTMGDTGYSRELFSSPVDQAIIVRLACDQPGRLSFDAVFERIGAKVEADDDDRLVISGIAVDSENPDFGGVSYEAQIQFLINGGRLAKRSKGIRVEGGNEVELRIVAATDYHGENPHAVCERQLQAIAEKEYAALLRDHIAEHQRLFRRVELNLKHTAIP
jgi:alpha-L-fucosidase 2